MKLQVANNFKNCRPLPPIFYNSDQTTRNTPTEKARPVKIDIKAQPEEKNSETVAIYVTIFRTENPESLLKFVTILNNTIKGQDLYTGPHKYGMNRNIVVGESL